MKTVLIEGNAIFSSLSSEWDGLLQHSMTNTPFQFLAYQQSWWRHLGPENGRLYSVVVRHDDGRLAAIAPFFLQDQTLYLNGTLAETDYLDLIVAEADADAAWTAVFDCLCCPDMPDWHTLDICNVPAASLSRQILPQQAEKRGFSFTSSVIEVCPTIPLPDTFDAYLDAIDPKQRRELQRKLRRAEGSELGSYVVTADHDLTAELNIFLDLLQKSTFEKRDWLTEPRRALFHDVAQAAMAAGMLQLMFIELDGRQLAALFNFDYQNRIWVYNSGLDPNAATALSPGVIMTAKAIEHAIAHGRSEFDFLRGNETYKYRFGAQDANIYRYQLSRNN